MSESVLLYGVALVLGLGVCALWLRPLLSKHVPDAGAHTSEAAQRASLREAYGAIEAELASGAISPALAEARRAELLARARAEQEQADASGALHVSERQTRTALLCMLGVLALAAATYGFVGQREGLTAAKRSAAPATAQVTPEQIAQMVARLEARLTAEAPKAEDLPQWKMLARSQIILGNLDQAVAALRTVLQLGGETAENQANLAEALLAQRAGKPNEEIVALLRSAYAKNPKDQKVLWLSAAVAQESGDIPSALKYLNELLPTVDPAGQEAADIKRFIAELSK